MADFKAGTAGAIKQPPPDVGFLGQGVSYPLQYDSTGRLKLSSGVQLVAEALQSICLTAPGERVMEPDYGANVQLFEPNDVGRFSAFVQQNIENHEPRIRTYDVTIQPGSQPSESQVTITYTVATAANAQTLTVPVFSGPSTTPPDEA